jgi:hypothetical protein
MGPVDQVASASDGREALVALRARIAATRMVPCAMAHEAILVGPDGAPRRSAQTQSGYLRSGLCPEGKRATHIGCTHTMARYALQDALRHLPGEGRDALVAELKQLEDTISILDHRRYGAEIRRAEAMLGAAQDAVTAAEAEIARLIAEHRACGQRVMALRDEVLRRLDAAL